MKEKSDTEDVMDHTPLQSIVCSGNAKIAMNYVETAITLVGYKKFSEKYDLMRFLNVENAECLPLRSLSMLSTSQIPSSNTTDAL